jgi:hypothetical protein
MLQQTRCRVYTLYAREIYIMTKFACLLVLQAVHEHTLDLSLISQYISNTFIWTLLKKKIKKSQRKIYIYIYTYFIKNWKQKRKKRKRGRVLSTSHHRTYLIQVYNLKPNKQRL